MIRFLFLLADEHYAVVFDFICSILFAALFVSLVSENTDCLAELCEPALLQTLLFLAYRVNTPPPAPASDASSRSEPAPAPLGKHLRLPVETIRYTLLGLANLSAHPRSHAYILEELHHLGAAAFFVHARSADVGCREYFTLLLANTVSAPAMHPPLLDPACFITLEPLLTHPSFEPKPVLTPSTPAVALAAAQGAGPTEAELRVLYNVLVFVANIGVSHAARTLVSTHMLDALFLCALALTEEPEQQATAREAGDSPSAVATKPSLLLLTATILSDLALTDAAKQAMLADGRRYRLAPVVQRLLDCRSVQVRRAAILIVARVTELDALHAVVLMSAPLREAIVTCVQSADEQIQTNAVRAVAQISANPNLSLLHTLSAVAWRPDLWLRGAVSSPFAQCRKYALIALGNAASHPHAVLELEQVPLIPSFMRLAADVGADFEEKMVNSQHISCRFSASCFQLP
jgi:hypothetical protein